MIYSDVPIEVRIVGAAVASLVGWFLFRYFNKTDRTLLTAQQASGALIVVSSFQYEPNKLENALQNAVIVSVYAMMGIIFLEVGVVAVGLVPRESLGQLGVEVLASVMKVFPLLMFFGTLIPLLPKRSQFTMDPIKQRVIPNYLYSRKYSLVHELYVDKDGFEGVFALPWRRVYRCEPINDCSLKISYRRFPSGLSRLIGADTIVLTFNTREEMQQIYALRGTIL